MTAFIGGEFWDDPTFDTDHVTVPTEGMVFLNGGEAALRVICDHLISKGIHQILLPSYICSTMADAFDRYGIEYTFYRIGEDFHIDLADLLERASKFQVVYVVNYFGYGFSAEELVVFEQAKGSRRLAHRRRCPGRSQPGGCRTYPLQQPAENGPTGRLILFQRQGYGSQPGEIQRLA